MSFLQVNILLLALGGLQGLFLFFLLFKKRKSIPGYPWLAAYLGVMLLQVTMKIVNKLWLMQNLGELYTFSYQLPFLYGPLLYLFICRFTGYRQPGKKDVLHFIPAIIVISLFIFTDIVEGIPAVFLFLFNYKVTVVLQLASIITYHALAIRILKKQYKQLSSATPGAVAIHIKWLRRLTVTSMVICAVIAATVFLMYINNPHWRNVRFGFVSLTLFIYWIGYRMWSQPELFAMTRGHSDESGRLPEPALTVHLPARKYANSGLQNEEMSRIITALETKMRREKLYLDPDLTIDELAVSLNCSRHHLSQAINRQLDKSFYDCINYYRVEEAKVLLCDPAKDFHKIASIAFDSGFNSISTFNDVFKKITALTPSQYRKLEEERKLRRQRV